MTAIIWALVVPSRLLLIGLCLGLLALTRSRTRRLGKGLTVASAALLALIGLTPTVDAVARWWEAPYEDPTLPGSVKAIVVLGGAERPLTSVGRLTAQANDAAERLQMAALLQKQYPTARIIHTASGPLQPGVPSQSATARQMLLSFGTDISRWTFDDRAVNTRDNAVNTAGILGQWTSAEPEGSILLVTSAFHMPRAVACFRKLDIAVTPVAADFLSTHPERPLPGWFTTFPWRRFRSLDLLVHEWIGLGYYRLRNWI